MFCKHSGYTDASRIANGLRRLLSQSHCIRLDFLQWWQQTILCFNAVFLVQGQGACNISNRCMDPLIKSFRQGKSSSSLLFCPTFKFIYSKGEIAPNLHRLSYVPYHQSLYLFHVSYSTCQNTYPLASIGPLLTPTHRLFLLLLELESELSDGLVPSPQLRLEYLHLFNQLLQLKNKNAKALSEQYDRTTGTSNTSYRHKSCGWSL